VKIYSVVVAPLVITWTDLCFTRQVNATRRNDTEVVRELVARGAPIEFASTPQDGEDLGFRVCEYPTGR